MKVRLGDVCELINGYPFKPSDWSDAGLPIIRIQNLNDDTAPFNYFSGVIDKKYIVENGDLLFSWSGTPGTSFGAFFWNRGRGVLNQHIFNVHLGEELLKDYLRYALNGNLQRIISKAHGGVGLQHITKKELESIEILVPPIHEQRRIAAVLDKVSDLIAKRRAQLDKLDELVKARFVEMFGDPIENNKGLPTIMGLDLFKLSNGKFVPENKRFNKGIPAYGGNGISWYTDEVLCKENSIVVGRVGFQSGNIHFVEGPLWVTDNAMYVSEYNKDKCDLYFLSALMDQIDFTRFQDAGDLKKITQKPFMRMKYIVPDMSCQRKYVRFVKSTGKSKLTIQHSLDKLEILKKALMQEYFG